VDRLGRDVAGHEAAGRAAEAAVGEQRDGVAEPFADDRRGDREHLAHAGASRRALVADHDDVARVELPARDRGHRLLLALEHARRALVVAALVAGELDHAALGRQVAAQDRDPAGLLDRVLDRADDLLARRLLRLVRVPADRLAGHRRRVLVQQAEVLQPLRQDRGAAGGVQVGGHEPPAGLEVAQRRRRFGDPVEVVDVERDAGFAGHGEQVQDAVGRAAGGGDGEDRVLDRLAGDDVARPLTAPQDVHDELARGTRDLGLARVLRRHQARADRADAHHLEGHRHRVGRVLAAAGADARARRGLDVRQLLLGDLAGGERADGLEDIHDRDVAALVVAGRDRAAVEHHAGHVEAGERHHRAGSSASPPCPS
jgi:hypothetical protein